MPPHKSKNFGFAEMSIFLLALVGGTLCSLSSKIMLTMKGEGMSGEQEDFSFPLFQTFGMFLGMTAALGGHWAVVKFRIPFPGYPGYHSASNPQDDVEEAVTIPFWKIMILAIPSVFDLAASALAMYGLRHVNVSIYQMLRGSAIIFVALLKQFFLKCPLQRYKWVGIAFNVLSIVLVGLTALLSHEESEEKRYNSPMTGVVLILCGAFVQSLQYAFEEKVMNDEDTAIPPLLLIGMEGFWGTLLCIFFLYPIAYHIPGSDHGCLENPFNTWYMLTHSTEIQWVFVLYFFSILQYNVLAVLVTFMLDSVWHAILDNFRPVTVWSMDLVIFYYISSSFGEKWTGWSFLQLLGMFVLLYGTAIYNAPNAGSLKLTGDWKSLFIDCSSDYDEVQAVPVSQSDPDKDSTRLTSLPSTVVPTPKKDHLAYRGITPILMMSPALVNRDRERRELARSMERDGLALLSRSQQRGGGYGGVDA